MKNKTFSTFCNSFYNCMYIPLYFYQENSLMLQLPAQSIKFDLAGNYLDALISSRKQVTYLTTRDFNYYGIVKSKSLGEYVVIGPVASTVPSKNTIKSIIEDASIPHEYFEEVFDFFQLIPILSFYQFLHILVLLNLELNGENICAEDIFDIENSSVSRPIGFLHTTNVYQVKEHQSFHNTYSYERQFLKHVEDGNTKALKVFLQKSIPINAGIVSDNNLRQAKNIFIAAITTITRAAIRGGMDIEIAYQLSDTYIMQMEKLQNIDAVYQLQYAMIMDFTLRVSESKIPLGITKDVHECIQFVSVNTNRHINISDVAAHIGKSRSYISRRFKAEIGQELNAFIMSKKLEEAKSLLTFTDKSINEISHYLCFSSQGYFQNVFKKKVGMTPNEYRNQFNH